MSIEKHPVKVVRTTDIAQGVREVVLESANPGLLPAFTPGAHVDLYLPQGLVRAYSLTNASGAEGAAQYVLAIGLAAASRGGSQFVHEQLRAGDLLKVGSPRNLFAMADDPAPALLIAGGIGITPLRAMARLRQAQGRPWQLVYAARSPAHAAYAKELLGHGDAVRFHFDNEMGGPLAVGPVLANLTLQTHLYCCGPQALMDRVRELAAGHPASHLHFESFGGQAPVAAGEGGRGFAVELARQGRVVQVPPERSIIDCLEASGVVVPSVCREGICGACECTVLGGEVEHRDSILSEAEKQANQTMMICVSRAKGERLVLDL
jgi:ferredoxin-NADP reductase